MKKQFFTFLLCMCLVGTLVLPAGASPEEKQNAFDENLEAVGHQIEAMEEEIHRAEQAIETKYEKEISANMQLIKNTQSSLRASNSAMKAAFEKRDSIKKQLQEERNNVNKEILEKYGYYQNDSTEVTSVIPKSAASDLRFSETPVTRNASTGVYRYTVDWTFKSQDSLWDTYDIAGVGMTNSRQYTIYKSFAKTFTNYGTESCYVDDKGNSQAPRAAFKDCISKRAESPSNGVLYNVKDGPMPNVCMPAESGRITVYVIKNKGVSGTPTNKLIASYAHNYKYITFNFQAKISNVGFNSSSGLLSVTYERCNGAWERASGGKFFP